jgi:hypothetical protein
MTFQELTKLSFEKLAKQPPLTFEQKKAQILRVKEQSKARIQSDRKTYIK